MSQQIAFQGGKEILKAAATIVGGTSVLSGVASSGGLLAFLAAVAPVALPVLAVGGAIALAVKLANKDEKKEENK